MGWRFRKRIQLLPGVKLNISKSGLSTTIGRKGASVNIGKNGAYLNTGVPGTGIYRRDRITSKENQNVHYSSRENASCLYTLFYLARFVYTFFAVILAVSLLFHLQSIDFSDVEFIKSAGIVYGFLIILYINPIYQFFKKIFTGSHKTKAVSKFDYSIDSELVKNKLVKEKYFDFDSDYFYEVLEAIKPLAKLYHYFDQNETISSNIDNSLPYTFGNASGKLSFLFHADIQKIYKLLGHVVCEKGNFKNKEDAAMFLLSYSTIKSEKLFRTTYEDMDNLSYAESMVLRLFKRSEKAFTKYPQEDYFFISAILERSRRRDLKLKYFTHLYNFFKVVAEADENLTTDESKWIDKLKTFAKLNDNTNETQFDIE